MANMIIKGVAFNPNNERHMELVGWINRQSNQSSFMREIIGYFYELQQQKKTFQNLQNETNLFDDFEIGGMD